LIKQQTTKKSEGERAAIERGKGKKKTKEKGGIREFVLGRAREGWEPGTNLNMAKGKKTPTLENGRSFSRREVTSENPRNGFRVGRSAKRKEYDGCDNDGCHKERAN